MKNKILKGLFFEGFGKTLLKILFIFNHLLVVRALGPENFGVYTLLVTVGGTFTLFIKFGLDEGVKRYFSELEGANDYKKLHAFFLHVSKIRTLFSLVGAVLVLFFTKYILFFLNIEFKTYYVFFVLFYLLAHSFTDIFETFLQVKFKQKFLNTTQVLVGFTKTALLIFLFYVGGLNLFYALFLLLADKIARTVIYGIKAFLASYESVSSFLLNKQDFKENYSNFKSRFYNYSLWSFLDSFFSKIIGFKSDYYLLSYFMGAGAVGYYKVANKFVSTAISFTLPKSAVGTMYNSAMIQSYSKHGKKVINKYFKNKIKLIHLLSLPIAFGGLVLGKDIIVLLYGADYEKVASLVFILLFFSISTKWLEAVSSILLALEKHKHVAKIKILSLINILLNILLIPAIGLYGAVVSTFVTKLIIISFLYLFVKKNVEVNVPWRDLANLSFASILMSGLVLYLKYSLDSIFSDYVLIPLLVIIGGVFYFSFIYYRSIVERDYFKYILNKIYKKIISIRNE